MPAKDGRWVSWAKLLEDEPPAPAVEEPEEPVPPTATAKRPKPSREAARQAVERATGVMPETEGEP